MLHTEDRKSVAQKYEERRKEIETMLFSYRDFLYRLEQKKMNGEKLEEREEKLRTALLQYHNTNCFCRFLLDSLCHSEACDDIRRYLYDFFIAADGVEKYLRSVEKE